MRPALVVFLMVLSAVLCPSPAYAEVRNDRAAAAQNAEAARRAREEVDRLQAEIAVLRAYVEALKAQLIGAGVDPVDGAPVEPPPVKLPLFPIRAVAPADAKPRPDRPVKTYGTVAAMLADIAGPAVPKPREWNKLTESTVQDWMKEINRNAAGKLPGNSLKVQTTLVGFEVREDTVWVALRPVTTAATFKGCDVDACAIGWWVPVDRSGPVAAQLARFKIGDRCTFSGVLSSFSVEQHSCLTGVDKEHKTVAGGVRIDGIAFDFEPGAQLSGFTSPPVEPRPTPTEGGGKLPVGIIR